MFARGKHALGICDRCGFTKKLKELRDEVRRGLPRNVLVCEECWDEDHPQLWHGAYEFPDPQGLENARPDTGRADSTGIFITVKVITAPLPPQLGEVVVTT